MGRYCRRLVEHSDRWIIDRVWNSPVHVCGNSKVQRAMATIPPHISCNRQVSSAWLFSFSFGGSYFTFSYFLPIYFQSVKNASATRLGIDGLALLFSCVLSSMIIGVGFSAVGYYNPFVISGMALYCVGCGLIIIFGTQTSFAR